MFQISLLDILILFLLFHFLLPARLIEYFIESCLFLSLYLFFQILFPLPFLLFPPDYLGCLVSLFIFPGPSVWKLHQPYSLTFLPLSFRVVLYHGHRPRDWGEIVVNVVIQLILRIFLILQVFQQVLLFLLRVNSFLNNLLVLIYLLLLINLLLLILHLVAYLILLVHLLLWLCLFTFTSLTSAYLTLASSSCYFLAFILCLFGLVYPFFNF